MRRGSVSNPGADWLPEGGPFASDLDLGSGRRTADCRGRYRHRQWKPRVCFQRWSMHTGSPHARGREREMIDLLAAVQWPLVYARLRGSLEGVDTPTPLFSAFVYLSTVSTVSLFNVKNRSLMEGGLERERNPYI
jgi:hypothetical protein